MIIKVETNTSDSIKSELIVIKRNGTSAGAAASLARSAARIFREYNWRPDFEAIARDDAGHYGAVHRKFAPWRYAKSKTKKPPGKPKFCIPPRSVEPVLSASGVNHRTGEKKSRLLTVIYGRDGALKTLFLKSPLFFFFSPVAHPGPPPFFPLYCFFLAAP